MIPVSNASTQTSRPERLSHRGPARIAVGCQVAFVGLAMSVRRMVMREHGRGLLGRRRTAESPTSERELRRRCRRLLRDLDIQPPLDVKEFCARLAAVRGRPIKLIPYPIWADGPFGLWLKGNKADYIVYQQHTTEPHQHHIILHEVGHILADHQSDETADDLRDFLGGGSSGDLPQKVSGRLRRRTAYDEREEREAETVATIILEWASVLDAMRLQPSSGPTEGVDAALSDRLGWL